MLLSLHLLQYLGLTMYMSVVSCLYSRWNGSKQRLVSCLYSGWNRSKQSRFNVTGSFLTSLEPDLNTDSNEWQWCIGPLGSRGWPSLKRFFSFHWTLETINCKNCQNGRLMFEFWAFTWLSTLECYNIKMAKYNWLCPATERIKWQWNLM